MSTTPNAESAGPPDFDRLAHIYRWMELASFGPWLHWCRCTFVDEVADRRRALFLGDGDGRFTARLLHLNREIQIEAIDASSAMLSELLRHAGPNADRVRTWNADARNWCPQNPPFDLVVTHFFLDCLTTAEIESLVAKVSTAVTPSAKWLLSEFAIPTGLYGQLFARPLIRSLYWAFGRLTGLRIRNLPDHRAALRRSGLSLIAKRHWLGGLLVSELWSFNAHGENL
jgi:ubiquinone/menaquinone biosynthesis C-methylase UbiE